MKKVLIAMLAALLLTGCAAGKPAETEPSESAAPTEASLPADPVTPTESEPTLPAIAEPEAKIGEFFNLDEMTLPQYDPNGAYYGFPDDFFCGCSVWCGVSSRDTHAAASSELSPMGAHSYEAAHLLDGSRATAWAEGADGSGIGQCVRVSYCYNWDRPENGQKFDYRTICIVNGYAENETKWRENGRVKTLEVAVNGQARLVLHLADSMKPQFFDISQLGISTLAGETIGFSFRIAEVYEGEKYSDTCLTGIAVEFWTPNH